MTTEHALRDVFISPNCADTNLEAANVVDGLYQVASAIRFAGKHLGKEDASGPMGAIEDLSKSVLSVSEAIRTTPFCGMDAEDNKCLLECAHRIERGLTVVGSAIDRIASEYERRRP